MAEEVPVLDRNPGEGGLVDRLADLLDEVSGGFRLPVLRNHAGKADHATLGLVEVGDFHDRDVELLAKVRAKFIEVAPFERDVLVSVEIEDDPAGTDEHGMLSDRSQPGLAVPGKVAPD